MENKKNLRELQEQLKRPSMRQEGWKGGKSKGQSKGHCPRREGSGLPALAWELRTLRTQNCGTGTVLQERTQFL